MTDNNEHAANNATWNTFILTHNLPATPPPPRPPPFTVMAYIEGLRAQPPGLVERAVHPTVERRTGTIFLYPLGDTLGTGHLQFGIGSNSTWAFSELTPTSIAFMILTRGTAYGDNTIRAELYATMDPNADLHAPGYRTWHADGTPTALLTADGAPISITMIAPTHLYALNGGTPSTVADMVMRSRQARTLAPTIAQPGDHRTRPQQTGQRDRHRTTTRTTTPTTHPQENRGGWNTTPTDSAEHIGFTTADDEYTTTRTDRGLRSTTPRDDAQRRKHRTAERQYSRTTGNARQEQEPRPHGAVDGDR